MNNPFHMDWLRRFREDLRVGDMDSLTNNVELAGLDVVLDADFLALACQEDARSVVVLIATLGEANSENPSPYRRWLATYQYLQGQLQLDEAAQLCADAVQGHVGYYTTLLGCALKRIPIDTLGAFTVRSDDLEFGINLLVNTGHSSAIVALLKAWQSIDRSDMPWLRACRATAARRPHLHVRQEAADLASTTQFLLDKAPKQLAAVQQEMRVQCAELALKAGNKSLAHLAAQKAFDNDPSVERRFTLAKAHVLRGDLPTAVQHMHELLLYTLNNGVATDSAPEISKPSSFDVLAAEDTLISVNRLLRAKGLQPFLMSGTLLGYVRHGALLPHDKDIDLGLIGWEHQFTVAQALLEAGHFRIDVAQLSGQNRFLMSAHDVRNGMAVDFFLFHDKGDHFLHGIDFDMGFTQNFRFSKFDLQEVEFLDERFYVPSDADRNLTENYGDWRTPATSYVVTVESPALCDTPDSRTLLVYLEILKTITKHMKPQRVARILDRLAAQKSNILDEALRTNLQTWCSKQIEHEQWLQEQKSKYVTTSSNTSASNEIDKFSNFNSNNKPIGKIRIGFLIHATEIFSALEPIIRKLQTLSSLFELYFFAIPRNYTGHRGDYSGANIPFQMLRERYSNVTILDGNSRKDLMLLKQLGMDFIFRQSPWDHHIPAIFSSQNLAKFNLCYVPYGFMTADIPDQQYNQPFHNYCKLIFCETDFHLNEFNNHRTLRKNGVHNTGYPRFELMVNEFQSTNLQSSWPISAGLTLPKIIWAPHHSIGSHWLNYSTFLQHKDLMLDHARKKKISILFRPHPALREKLLDRMVMTNAEYDQFLADFNETETSQVDTSSEYIDSFASSNYMITDGVGFFSEYLLTGKPLIHTRKEKSQPLNKSGKWMMDAFRKADNTQQLNEVLNEITTHQYIDLEFNIRNEKRHKLTSDATGASERIIEILKFNCNTSPAEP